MTPPPASNPAPVTARRGLHDASPRVALGVGLLVLVAAVASVMPQLRPNTWMFRDGRFYANVATTIVEDLSLDQHRFAGSWYSGTLGWNRDLDPGWSNVALGARGEFFPKHPWLHPLLASPVVFAFGLPATLGWNLLMFALIGAGLYRWARGVAAPVPAALATSLFVFGTAVVQSAYDFSVDVLMLALFAQGLAAVLGGRGARAGVLVALAVVIKPTALMLLPALALTLLEVSHVSALRRSLLAGAGVLAAQAGANTWMYGRPWWSGYNRTLVTRDGAPVVADHLDAFSTPFVEGFLRTWGGPYGLVHTFTALALGAPGLLVLLRRRPLHAIGVVFSVAASLVVFSKYEYEGHRFHWPALAMLVPAMAVSLEVLEAGLAALGRRLRGTLRPRFGDGASEGVLVAAVTVAACLAALPFGPSIEARVLRAGAWGQGALGLAGRMGLEGNGASFGVVALHLALAGLLVSRTTRLASHVAPPALAAVAVAAASLLPEVRDAWLEGGHALLTLAGCAFTLERWSSGRPRIAALGAVAALTSLWLWPAPEAGAWTSWPLLLAAPGAARMVLPWLALGVPGSVLAVRRAPIAGAALALLSALALVPGVGLREGWFAVSLPLVAAPSAVGADALARLVRRATSGWGMRRFVALAGAVFALLLAVGGARRASASGAPFQLASDAAVRAAHVFHGEVPCDFLAWEHMGWECSHFDVGLYGMVGLALSEGIRVGGEIQPLLLVPTGRGGQERRVVWDAVRAGRRLDVRWAVPDGEMGLGVLELWADGTRIARIETPARGDAAMHPLRIETPAIAGRTVRFELRARPLQGHRPASIALDAVWR